MTSCTGDDGQEITELAFTPDGKSLVYVRGGEHGSPIPRSSEGWRLFRMTERHRLLAQCANTYCPAPYDQFVIQWYGP